MEVNGKEIAIEEHGDGDAVVMVHGLGGTGNSWYPQVGPLARFFRVVRLDLEGSGRSPATGTLSIASFAADVTAVMDELDIPTAHLCGHSMGTIVCQHIAAEHPERVKNLALLGPLAEPPEPARQAIRDRASRCAQERHGADRRYPGGGRDLGRDQIAPAGGSGIRARDPHAPGRRGLRADLRGPCRREEREPRQHPLPDPCW